MYVQVLIVEVARNRPVSLPRFVATDSQQQLQMGTRIHTDLVFEFAREVSRLLCQRSVWVRKGTRVSKFLSPLDEREDLRGVVAIVIVKSVDHYCSSTSVGRSLCEWRTLRC